MSQPPNTVVVTGFGPFQTHDINSSWEVAKALTKLNLESHGVNLIIEQIPVSYSTVLREVPQLWEEWAPKLVVHLGLSSITRDIKLESTAHKCGYCKPDNDGNCPVGGSCNGKDDVLCTQIDLVRVIERIRKLPEVHVCVDLSSDAGRYVCEFTYYTSLNINSHRAVFVHVPDIDKPYSVKDMAVCVKYIILYLLEETMRSPDHPKTKM